MTNEPLSQFDGNYEKLKILQPETALAILKTSTTSYPVTLTEANELNLLKRHRTNFFLLHCQKSASEEALQWFRTLNLKNTLLLYVYGIGLGYYYDAAKIWLGKGNRHHLIFLEDDIEVLKAFLNTKKATEILDHPQVRIYYISKVFQDCSLLAELKTYFMTLPAKVDALLSYKKNHKEELESLKEIIIYQNIDENTKSYEYLCASKNVFKNFISNFNNIRSSYHGNKLFNQFKAIPAIITGAGPSLNKQMEELRQIKDNALILSGGSSLSVLSSGGVIPHFGVGIDPNHFHYQTLVNNWVFNIPFFYRLRMHKEAVNMIHGPRLYLNGAGGYPLASWLEHNIGLIGDHLDEGNNVVNFAIEIAKALGCNPIILVGVDLAYTDQQTYSTMLPKDPLLPENVNDEDISINKVYLKKDIYDKPILTLWKWIQEAEWISHFAKKNPDITLINATEGGLGFDNIANLPLKTVLKIYCQKTFHLKNFIHSAIQNASLKSIDQNQIIQTLQSLTTSLSTTVSLLKEIIHEHHMTLDTLTDEYNLLQTWETNKMILCKMDLYDEPAMKYLLQPIDFIAKKIMKQQIEQYKYIGKKADQMEQKTKTILAHKHKYQFILDMANEYLPIFNSKLMM